MDLLILIYEFLKTGLFSVGGGLASVPFLYAMADNYPWFSRELVVDMIAISEATPGPIGIKMAAYAGYATFGITGGISASLAIVVPASVMMVFLVKALDRVNDNKYVKAAFYGLRPAVTALIASAGIGLAIDSFTHSAVSEINFWQADFWHSFDWRLVLLFAVMLTAAKLYKRIQPLHLIAAGAVIGVVFKL